MLKGTAQPAICLGPSDSGSKPAGGAAARLIVGLFTIAYSYFSRRHYWLERPCQERSRGCPTRFAGGAQAVEEDHGAVHDQRTGSVDGGGQHCRAGVDGGSDAAAGVAAVGFGLAVDGGADGLHAGGATQPP